MASGLRQRAARGWVLLLVPFLLCACSKRQTIREDPPRAAVVEAMIFLSSVQGNPVCVVIDINKHRSSSLFSSPKTKWRMNGWLLSPGLSTYLGTLKGKSKQGSLAPVSSTKDELLFTTDKDQFLYYVRTEAEKILLLTDPLFADRVRSGQDEEIRYGRMPAKLFCNNRTVEGTLFYQRWAWIDPPQQKRKGPFAGLEPGGRLFALWGPGGEFLYVEKGAGDEQGGKAKFAIMQDRRGRWQETSQVRWTEPECAFSPTPCPGESQEFGLSIPGWDVEGSLQKLDQVLIPTEVTGADGAVTEKATTEGGSLPQDTFWNSLRAIPQAKGGHSVEFCLLKGDIWVEQNQKAVYGIGLFAKKP
jgi:hypothetical protein